MSGSDSVTAFLIHDGRILVLRGGGAEGGRWAGIGGPLESEPLAQAYAAIRAATGLGEVDVELVKRGEPFHVYDPESKHTRRIHPFLFAVGEGARVRLAVPRTSRRWVWPGELDALDTAPGLSDALHRVYP